MHRRPAATFGLFSLTREDGELVAIGTLREIHQFLIQVKALAPQPLPSTEVPNL
jgi:hypothetical protein